MNCINGIKVTPDGESGVYLICQLDWNKDNACRFVRFCKQENDLVPTTDKNGNFCQDFSLKRE